jgi:hypothetical protein
MNENENMGSETECVLFGFCSCGGHFSPSTRGRSNSQRARLRKQFLTNENHVLDIILESTSAARCFCRASDIYI